MTTIKATVIALSVTGALAGIGVQAHASEGQSDSNQPFEGIVVTDIVKLKQLPDEVRNGSIEIGKADEQAIASMAKLLASDALRIATRAAPGKTVDLRLDEDNGYLIWEVTQISSDGNEVQLKLDAGNGRLLAAERGDSHENADEDRHESWNFREDNDADEGKSG